jgi:hypothetical protein
VPDLESRRKTVFVLAGHSVMGWQGTPKYIGWKNEAAALQAKVAPIHEDPDATFKQDMRTVQALYSAMQRDKVDAGQLRILADGELSSLEAERVRLLAEKAR